MRTFEASVKNKNVICKPMKMHVPPHAYEEFGVCLDEDSEKHYRLKVTIGPDPRNSLSQQRLSSSAIVVLNENRSLGEAKFSIELVPLPGSKAPAVAPLDPIFVNE